jgi:hypothetical protein
MNRRFAPYVAKGRLKPHSGTRIKKRGKRFLIRGSGISI